MKKSVIIIVFLFVFRPVMPLVDYLVNYDYIAKVLCENKTKPELKCNGKCHLMKQLAKASEGEKSEQKDKKNTAKIEWEVPFLEVRQASLFSKLLTHFNPHSFSIYKNCYSFLSLNGEFHPPTVLIK